MRPREGAAFQTLRVLSSAAFVEVVCRHLGLPAEYCADTTTIGELDLDWIGRTVFAYTLSDLGLSTAALGEVEANPSWTLARVHRLYAAELVGGSMRV